MSMLAAVLLLQAEEVYKKTPQAELKIQIWSPKEPGAKRPAVVFFFGGGWTSGSVTQFSKQAAYLAGRGMVAACADYRVKSRHGVTPDACVEDAKSAVRWLRASAERLGTEPRSSGPRASPTASSTSPPGWRRRCGARTNS